MTRDEILSLFARREAAWRNHDAVALAADHHPEGVVVSPTGGVLEGRAAIEHIYRVWLTAFPDLVFLHEDMIIDDDRVAALCRVAVQLITRAHLHHADSGLTPWYSILSSTGIFAAASLLTWTWHGPQTAYGLFAMILLSLSTVIAVLALFVSIKRIGPFRSALIMNLEPLLATIISAPVLGELITPVQAAGGAIMLAALVAFQLRR